MIREHKRGRILAGALLAMALGLGVTNLQAQEGRKALSNPAPTYPEVAKKLRLVGTVKVQVVIGADGVRTDGSRKRASSAATRCL
jgi:hypothetical protein